MRDASVKILDDSLAFARGLHPPTLRRRENEEQSTRGKDQR